MSSSSSSSGSGSLAAGAAPPAAGASPPAGAAAAAPPPVIKGGRWDSVGRFQKSAGGVTVPCGKRLETIMVMGNVQNVATNWSARDTPRNRARWDGQEPQGPRNGVGHWGIQSGVTRGIIPSDLPIPSTRSCGMCASCRTMRGHAVKYHVVGSGARSRAGTRCLPFRAAGRGVQAVLSTANAPPPPPPELTAAIIASMSLPLHSLANRVGQ